MTADPEPNRATPAKALARAAHVSRLERKASLHALHVLEYALSAPTPRRERTWLHRVLVAVDALADALDEEIHSEDRSVGLLSEIALSEPRHALAIQRLRDEQLALRVAVASIREQVEPDAEIPIDVSNVRERLADVARRYRQHRANESDVVYDAVGIELHLDET